MSIKSRSVSQRFPVFIKCNYTAIAHVALITTIIYSKIYLLHTNYTSLSAILIISNWFSTMNCMLPLQMSTLSVQNWKFRPQLLVAVEVWCRTGGVCGTNSTKRELVLLTRGGQNGLKFLLLPGFVSVLDWAVALRGNARWVNASRLPKHQLRGWASLTSLFWGRINYT